ncbi:MAG: SGNH/GDSL hydrolase family protein [Oscillospiraceae bacterium]|nr:SGNH/GDSL hydrolase family protein [Oscillospiraceae bacterium]
MAKMRILEGMTPFPCDAESSPFFGAMATALLPAMGYTEGTPFYCGPKGSFCIECGDCEGKSVMQRHHLQLYHDLQTFTGVSLGWDWPDAKEGYHAIPGWEAGWDYPDGFMAFIYGYAGLAWRKVGRGMSKEGIHGEVRASIDSGLPVLMKLGEGRDWHVAVGYGPDLAIVAADARGCGSPSDRPTVRTDGYTPEGYAVIRHWMGQFKAAYVIEGKAEKTVGFSDVITRMILTLASPAHRRLEGEFNSKLDTVCTGNARETAEWLLGKVGFPIEARWHAADSSLPRLHGGPEVREKVLGMVRQYMFDDELESTHKACWAIWGVLGVGPHTGYALPEGGEKALLDVEKVAEIRRLFGVVLENDRVALKALREAARASIDFEAHPVPTVDPFRDPSYGRHIGRTMRLLAESGPDRRNKVRIAFTGQSIVDPNNTWPPDLADWLRREYPHADIAHKVFAIGGFSTDCLYKRVPNDMASFYPDLAVIYVAGSEVYYDRLVRWIRENTAAEIMILTDHYTTDHWWSDKMAGELLPAIAERYGAQIAGIRTHWKRYFEENALSPQGLLVDGGHLFDTGQAFMLGLMKQFFVRNPAAGEAVREKLIPVRAEDWVGGRLTLPFRGNRAEAVAGPGPQGAARVYVDGRKPSEIPGLYIRTAENTSITSRMGIVGYNGVPGEQDFTVRIEGYEDARNFSYSVVGSVTGFEGRSDGKGELNGRILRMDHESFVFHPGVPAPKVGDEFGFRSLLNGTDIYGGENPYLGHPEKAELFEPGMLFSGLPVGEHTLVLEAEGAIPDIAAIKVYDPSSIG